MPLVSCFSHAALHIKISGGNPSCKKETHYAHYVNPFVTILLKNYLVLNRQISAVVTISEVYFFKEVLTGLLCLDC